MGMKQKEKARLRDAELELQSLFSAELCNPMKVNLQTRELYFYRRQAIQILAQLRHLESKVSHHCIDAQCPECDCFSEV